jgi:predicted Zn-dependent protease
LRLRRTRDAADSFREVLRDDPDDAYAALELGLITAAQGRKEDAIALLRRSLAQDPRDPLVMAVLEDVEAGKRVSPAAVNERIARDALTVAD